MGILDDILYDLRHYAERAQQNQMGGPAAMIVPRLPEPLQGPASVLSAVPSRQFDLAKLVMDAFSTTGKMATGLGYVTGPTVDSPEQAAAQTAFDNPANGDIFQRYLAANEGAASKNPLMTGALNMALDPSNLLNPVGKGLGLIDTAPLYAGKAMPRGSLLKSIGETGLLSAKEGVKTQKAAMAGVDTEAVGMRSIYTDWKTSVVNRFRNPALQDVGFNLMNMKRARIPGQDVSQRFASTVDNAKAIQSAGGQLDTAMPASTNAIMRLWGVDADFSPAKWGLGFLESGQPTKAINPMASAILQTLYSLANPLRAGVAIPAAAAEAVFGYLRPFHNEFYAALGHITQTPFRSAGWEYAAGQEAKVAANTFLGAVDQLDPAIGATLRATGRANHAAISKVPNTNLVNIAPESLFGADDVEKAFLAAKRPVVEGKMYAQQWQEAVTNATEAGYDFAKDKFGDFSLTTDTQRTLDYIQPFLRWVRIAYPRTFQSLLENPSVSGDVLQGTDASGKRIERTGLPDYLRGTIPISTETKGLGGVARAYLGGRKGTMNVDLTGIVSPVGADITGIGNVFDKNTKPVQKALDVAGLFGAGGVNPILSNLLYAGGLTDKPPSPTSVYSGIDNAMPGPQLPSLLNGLLNAARKAGGNSQIGDEYESAAKQMVFGLTGKPVDDPSNKRYAIEIAQKKGVYLEAKKAVDAGGAFRSVAQYFNPTNISTTTDESAQYYQAKHDNQSLLDNILTAAGLPAGTTPQDIGQVNPQAAVRLQQLIDQVTKGNPASEIFQNPDVSRQDLQDPRLTLWQIQNASLRANFPTVYKQKEAEFMRSLGITAQPAEPAKGPADTPIKAPNIKLPTLR